MACGICKKTNHATPQCKFNKNGNDGGKNKKNNQNNRVDKNNNKKQKNKKGGRSDSNDNNHNNYNNNNGRNSSSNKNGKKNILCTRCGLRGHEHKNCTTGPLPGDDICECQSEYHKSHQCPWNRDYLERENVQRQATGKLCQWCKSDGDGLHEYNECVEPKKFSNKLLSNIGRAYDSLAWCWHCSSLNHRTQGCDMAIAHHGKQKWEMEIRDVIEKWVHFDTSEWQNNDMDVEMVMAGKNKRPPEAADFKWCILCETFGHWANESGDCDETKYHAKCPSQFKDRAIEVRKPFVPSGFQQGGGGGMQRYSGFGAAIAQSFSMPCQNHGCKAQIVWPVNPPKFGMSISCHKCHQPNVHPFGGKSDKDPSYEFTDMILNHVSALLAGVKNQSQKKSKKQLYLENEKNEYRKRPSIAMTNKVHTEIKEWPLEQPYFHDWSMLQKKPAVLNHAPFFPKNLPSDQFHNYNGENYFNCIGNFQEYFPAYKFQIKKEWRDMLEDDKLPINCAGRMGMELKCISCGTPIRVHDDEGDAVMGGNDTMCAVASGSGIFFHPQWGHAFIDDYGRLSRKCKCLTIAGQQPNIGWMKPAGF